MTDRIGCLVLTTQTLIERVGNGVKAVSVIITHPIMAVGYLRCFCFNYNIYASRDFVINVLS